MYFFCVNVLIIKNPLLYFALSYRIDSYIVLKFMNAKNTSASASSAKATKVATKSINAKKASSKQVNSKQQAAKPSSYKTNVLDVNAYLKVERLKLGYCIDELLKSNKLNSSSEVMLRKAKKDTATYKHIEANVRKTKNGFNAFYLLQYLHKVCK